MDKYLDIKKLTDVEIIDDMEYINATKICEYFNKKFAHWNENKHTKNITKEIEAKTGIDCNKLILSKKGNSNKFQQGSWVHSSILMNFIDGLIYLVEILKSMFTY